MKAPVVYEVSHLWGTFRVYKVGRFQYDVYRDSISMLGREAMRYRGSYPLKWLAIRRCRRG